MQYPATYTSFSGNNMLAMTQLKLAHDLKAPISALNFVVSLNPELPEDSVQLLKSAIERLEEIAAALEISSSQK